MIAGCFVIRNHQACSQRKKQDDKELRDIEHRGAMLSAARDQHTVNCVNEQDNTRKRFDPPASWPVRQRGPVKVVVTIRVSALYYQFHGNIVCTVKLEHSGSGPKLVFFSMVPQSFLEPANPLSSAAGQICEAKRQGRF